MIKYYTISNSVVRGHDVNIKKCFISRNDAIKYMLKYYRNRFINAEVLEENSLKTIPSNIFVRIIIVLLLIELK